MPREAHMLLSGLSLVCIPLHPWAPFQCYCYKGYCSPHLHKWFFNCRHFPTKMVLQNSAFHRADHQRQTKWKRNVSFVQKPGASLTKDFYLKAKSSITYTALPLKERTCFCENRKSSELNLGCWLLHHAHTRREPKQSEVGRETHFPVFATWPVHC